MMLGVHQCFLVLWDFLSELYYNSKRWQLCMMVHGRDSKELKDKLLQYVGKGLNRKVLSNIHGAYSLLIVPLGISLFFIRMEKLLWRK